MLFSSSFGLIVRILDLVVIVFGIMIMIRLLGLIVVLTRYIESRTPPLQGGEVPHDTQR
jgi:hypothetical protein